MFVHVFYVINVLVVSSLAKDCGLVDLFREKSFPWTVNVYEVTDAKEYKFVCSGTALSPKLVLTVASCFYDNENKSKKFFISVGQKLKNWNPRSTVQEISINNVIKPKTYSNGKYSNNIALIKLSNEKKVDLQQSVCINWDNEFVDLSNTVNPPQVGIVAWQNGKNTTYQIIQPSYLDLDLCRYYLSTKRKQQYLTYDKLCLQLEDVNTVPSLGSGVFVLDKTTNRWFLIGLTSEVTLGDSCVYVSYVKVSTHLNWLSNVGFLDL